MSDRWHYLTAPLPVLLAEARAYIGEVSGDGLLLGRLEPFGPILLVQLTSGLSTLERDGVVRGLLARRAGVDVSDWPVDMEWSDEPQAARTRDA